MTYANFETKPKTRTHVIPKDKRNAILERFGTAVNFWKQTGSMDKISRDSLYRAFRGEPVTLQEATVISSAWTDATYTYLSRETALRILEFGVEAAKQDTNVPLTVKTVFADLAKLNHEEPF